MRNTKRYGFAFILLAALLLFLLLVNVCAGSVAIPLADALRILTGQGGDDNTYRDIILQIRFPRALAAIILGGALALSGYLLQTFFHNPIAGPFILGISSGAKLVVALAMVGALDFSYSLRSLGMIL
ncbi:MAG: iron ABC transporter permease, partial [Lachnospiraceae bacterium]|nr:iron ABC transporter permease [Lachnospiraceae bacterium]